VGRVIDMSNFDLKKGQEKYGKLTNDERYVVEKYKGYNLKPHYVKTYDRGTIPAFEIHDSRGRVMGTGNYTTLDKAKKEIDDLLKQGFLKPLV